LDWTRGFNQYGWSKYTRIYSSEGKFSDLVSEAKYDRVYLDGKLGYIITYRGKPALTIGFCISNDKNLLITQIQLMKKRGNRWLYRLPYGYFDYVLLKLQETFPDFTLWLVEGLSLADKVKKAYGEHEMMSPLAYHHIIDIYNQPLELFERVGEKTFIGKNFYYQLRPI